MKWCSVAKKGPSGLMLTLLFGELVMGASSAQHAMCAPVSQWHPCCLVPFPLCLRRSVTRQSVGVKSPPPSCSPPASCDIWFLLVQHHSFCSFTLLKLTDLCCPTSTYASRTLFGHSLALSAEKWSCFIKTNSCIQCPHSIVHVQLDHCSTPSIWNVWILFMQNHDVSSSDDFLH